MAVKKGGERVDKRAHSNKDTVATLLKQLRQIKQVCVDIHGGDEARLLQDIKQRSRQDVLANLETCNTNNNTNSNNTTNNTINSTNSSLNDSDIGLDEIGELMPLNLNGKIKSRQAVYSNIEALLQRSELRKRRLLLAAPEHGDKDRAGRTGKKEGNH
ncbi:hypothetical protein MOSE0_M06018 [Monosporozyma servazzii]